MKFDFKKEAVRVVEILEDLEIAALLCKPSGLIVAMTNAARLDFETSGHLLLRNGFLLAIDSDDDHALKSELLRVATSPQRLAPAKILLRHPDQPPRFAKVASFPSSEHGDPAGHALVILAVRDDSDLRPHLRKAFGWSPAEAEIATSLAEGRSVRQIAGERATSISTVQTQVKAMIDKAGANSQVDLIAKIASLLAAQP